MALQPSLIRLLNRFESVVDTRRIAAAVESGSRRRLERLLNQAWATLTPGLRAELTDELITVTSTGYVSAWIALEGGRAITPPRDALRHARNQAARRVTGMTAAGRLVINELVTAAIAGGAGYQRLTRELLVQGLPVNRIQAGALRKQHARLQRLVEDGDLSPDDAVRRLRRTAKRMRRRRAITIARTEVAMARGWGRQRGWREQERRGIINARDWIKQWNTVGDERVDDRCFLLGQRTAAPNGRFFDGTLHPPRHPNCRCNCTVTRRERRRPQRTP